MRDGQLFSCELHAANGSRFIGKRDLGPWNYWWLVFDDYRLAGGFLSRDVARVVVRSVK
jgi:hypothetical protein